MTFSLDRRKLRILHGRDHRAPSRALTYWLARPPAERIAAVEFLRPTPENAVRVVAAVSAFGFPTDALPPSKVVDPRCLIEMGAPPVQLHLMSAIDGAKDLADIEALDQKPGP